MTFLRRSAFLLAALAASCGRDGNGNERPALSTWRAQAAIAGR